MGLKVIVVLLPAMVLLLRWLVFGCRGSLAAVMMSDSFALGNFAVAQEYLPGFFVA